MFDFSDPKYPKHWKDPSFDYKLYKIFLMYMIGSLLFQLITGITFSSKIFIVVSDVLLILLIVLSFLHRSKCDWHWPGVGIKRILAALYIIIFIIFFLTPSDLNTLKQDIQDPLNLPLYAITISIPIFHFLIFLRIFYLSESDFKKHCGQQNPKQETPSPVIQPRWKKIVTDIALAYFIAVTIITMGFFWKSQTAFRDGQPKPSAKYSEEITDHGVSVYITPKEKNILSSLAIYMNVGIPSTFLLFILLYVAFNINILHFFSTLYTSDP